MAALALAGALFTAGGVIYAVKRPNPFPRVFAHHEIFHVLVTAASGAVYLVVAVAVLPA